MVRSTDAVNGDARYDCGHLQFRITKSKYLQENEPINRYMNILTKLL